MYFVSVSYQSEILSELERLLAKVLPFGSYLSLQQELRGLRCVLLFCLPSVLSPLCFGVKQGFGSDIKLSWVISTARLNTLLHLHLRPIKVVVCNHPYMDISS